MSVKSFQKLIIKFKPTLNVLGVIILLLLLLLWALLHGLCFMNELDNTPISRSYFLLKAAISGMVIFFLLSFLMIKKEDVLSSLFSGVLTLYLSLVIAIFLGWGGPWVNPHWYLKYCIGIFIGTMTYFKKQSYWATCLITFLSMLICENAETMGGAFPPPEGTHNFAYYNNTPIEIEIMLLLFIVISPIVTIKLLGYLARLSFFR